MASFGNILWLLVIGGLFYFMLRRGGGCCGGHDEHNHQGGGADHGENQSDENLVLLEALNTKDPVCGMQVGEKETGFISTHMGKTFRFCSERCRKLFDLNPNKYVNASQGTHQNTC